MNYRFYFKIGLASFLFFVLSTSCRSRSNERSVKVEDLDRVMREEKEAESKEPVVSTLSVNDLVELSNCKDASCVQLFMKNKDQSFFYGKKGQFASLNRGVVADSSGNELIMPFSTLYFEVNTNVGATWRLAHILNKKQLSDQLLAAFISNGFALQDSIRYYATNAKCYRYTSEKFPGKYLYFSPTYKPWIREGLYQNVTWLCYVFEIHDIEQ